MINLKITRQTNNLESLMKRLRKLSENKVESGYFQEQGTHPEADISFAYLMYLHEYGFEIDGKTVPARPVRQITLHKIRQDFGDINLEIKKLVRDQKDPDDVLDVAGWKITSIATNLFGDGNYLEPNSRFTSNIKGRDEPLVDSGLLKNAWSWKNSIDNFLKNLDDGRG